MAESKPAAPSDARDFAMTVLTMVNDDDFDYNLSRALTVVSASPTPKPRVLTRLTVTRAMCNTLGTLHGGAISTLFDMCTTLALIVAGTWEIAGVTRTLSVTCLAPVFLGEEIEIEGEVVQVGKKLAHILAKMTLVRNGKLVATGVHDKAYIEPSAATSGRKSKL